MAGYKYIGTIALMMAGAIPFIGLMIVANLAQSRSAADLALADRCVEWAHETRAAQQEDGPELAARCDRYFQVRSNKDEDEDDRWWEARTHR